MAPSITAIVRECRVWGVSSRLLPPMAIPSVAMEEAGVFTPAAKTILASVQFSLCGFGSRSGLATPELARFTEKAKSWGRGRAVEAGLMEC